MDVINGIKEIFSSLEKQNTYHGKLEKLKDALPVFSCSTKKFDYY
jgi:hypothetical protein